MVKKSFAFVVFTQKKTLKKTLKKKKKTKTNKSASLDNYYMTKIQSKNNQQIANVV